MTTYALVYRTGGDYRMDDVRRLCEQIRKWSVDSQILLLTDSPELPSGADLNVRLQMSWPGWWSKMELFAPWLRGDLLYMDLDSMVVGALAPLEALCADRVPLILRDFNRPDGFQSSVMCIPEGIKRKVWGAWKISPDKWMEAHAVGGDQTFLEAVTRHNWNLWPFGHIVSYKVDVLPSGYIPSKARVVAFHGQPRPRDIGWNLPPHQTKVMA